MIKEYKKGKAVKVSDYFKSTEFDCKCKHPTCRITYIDDELVEQLTEHRRTWNRTVKITSGFRCTRHNKAVGGKPGSLHLVGKAADIVVDGLAPAKVQAGCEDFDGLGKYASFTHVDVRGYKARWRG